VRARGGAQASLRFVLTLTRLDQNFLWSPENDNKTD
jgi:hypothetical protein